MRKLFFHPSDPRALLADLEQPHGAFVATRLSFALGERVLLAVQLPGVHRPLQLPASVIGRRLPRGAHKAHSAGLFVRWVDGGHPMVELLREVASGRVVDLEKRILERQRTPATVRFHSMERARTDLVALLSEPGAALPIAEPVQRGDRLALMVHVDGDGPVMELPVLVRRVEFQEGRRLVVASVFDDVGAGALAAIVDAPHAAARQRA